MSQNTRLLRVQNEYFTAGAVWNKSFGLWSCIQSAPIIRWMRVKTPTEAKMELRRLGCSFEWVESLSESVCNTAPSKHSAEPQAQGSETPGLEAPRRLTPLAATAGPQPTDRRPAKLSNRETTQEPVTTQT